jgi:uncharacterized protein (TIGR01777 family)
VTSTAVEEIRSMSDNTTAGTIAVSGSTGLVGNALCARLAASGANVLRLVRRQNVGSLQELYWDPQTGFITPERLNGTSAVVHLAGESIAAGRWTDDRKQRIRSSRVDGTRTLASALARLERPPRVLVCASAVGFYGDRGDELLDESSPPGTGFLADVCREWEAAAAPAAEAGIRVIHLRLGLVLSKRGGGLQKMLLPFKLGAGGRLGSGRQYWSWIHLGDVIGAFLHAVAHDELSGPVNAVGPHPATNAEFTQVLGHVLHRPTILPMPAFAARLALGEMADELLLSSARVLPRKLQGSGYAFAYTDLDAALRHELK